MKIRTKNISSEIQKTLSFVSNTILRVKLCKLIPKLDKCKYGISYRGPFV